MMLDGICRKMESADTKVCSGLGLRGQHSPLEVQHSSSELKTTWESEATGLMIKSVLQEPTAAG